MFHDLNIPFPSLFVCFVIFVIWLHYEKRKSSKKAARMSQEFWDREEQANHARNKDISQLELFCPDEKEIPMPQIDNENVCHYQKLVQQSLKLPMMNLSQYTNTDLKLAYGVGNFKTLSDYDENFNGLLMNMSNLAKAYSEVGFLEESASVYRLCLDYGSDKTTDYRALGNVYVKMNQSDKLHNLIREVEQSELPRRETLITDLNNLL